MSDDPQPSIGVGDRFPVEALPGPLHGPTVVYFYPQDLTSTCTIEAHGFNALYDEFRAEGARFAEALELLRAPLHVRAPAHRVTGRS